MKTTVHTIMAAALLLLMAFQIGGPQSAAAQRTGNELSCSAFETRESAQEYLDEMATDDPLRDRLDGDGNGLACDQPGEGFEVCSDFASRAEAQDFVDRYVDGAVFPLLEDDDGDGFYCEAFFGTEADEDTDSPDVGEEDSTDSPDVGEEDSTDDAATAVADDDASVTGLPSTGTGNGAGASTTWLIASTMAAAMALIALSARTLATRRS